MQEDLFKRLVSHCKEYGFIYPSSEVYDGLGGVYDYGPMGAELKNNIKEYWWKAIVQLHENIVGIDSAIFMHPKIWKASGHVDGFNDPLIDNKDSKKRYRADQLIEGEIDKLNKKIDKEVEKARKRFDNFDEAMFRSTNGRVLDWAKRAEEINERMSAALGNGDMADLKALIDELQIADPESGSRNWTDVRQFNLMFSTQMSNIAGDDGKLYLRPETAQGIFVNFLNVSKTTRQKVPFGIAQIGKAFRNEIVARQFIFRMREFEQMEMQFFVRPGTEMEWYEYWKEKRMAWHRTVTPAEKLQFKPHHPDALAHYANAALDIEFEFPFGFKELEGIHSRTDFDLSSHQNLSGKKLHYFDPELNENYVPYVVETSIGVDRMFLAVMSNALVEETVPDAQGEDSSRTVLRIPPALAPVKCAVLPIVRNKEELVNKARSIYDRLKLHFPCQYDEKDAIGRRYRRQDAVGTPYCLTIDFDTMEDDTVTIRERDSMEQERVPVDRVVEIVREKTDMYRLLGTLV